MLVVSHQTALWLMTAPAVPAQLRRLIRERLGLHDYLPSEGMRDVARTTIARETTSLQRITPRQALLLWDSANPAGIPACKLGILHFLVPRGASRRPQPGACAHQWSGTLPPGALVRLNNDCYLCSPEFCFVQLAAHLSEANLALLGMALCGAYYPAGCARGFIDGPPLTSVNKLTAFLQALFQARGHRGCRGMPGYARARHVVALLANNARSPLESSTALLMHMPRSKGGYGLSNPELNRRMKLSPQAAAIFGRSTIRPDLRFPRARLNVECLGKPYHKHPERDIRRELALRHDGEKIILLTYGQLKDTAQREELMNEIARATGKRVRKLPERYRRRRTELVHQLFPGRERHAGALETSTSWALPAGLLAA